MSMVWCTSRTGSEEVIDQISNGTVLRRGAFWNAVDVARSQGRYGRGRKIAILDSGFDLSQPLLAGAVPNSRTWTSSATHGTAVALIVALVAPEATLLLKDVSLGEEPDGARIREALLEAQSEGADVVCMSFGQPFPWESLEESQLPILEVLAGQTDVDALGRILRDWVGAGSFKGHIRGGCDGLGTFCGVLDEELEDGPLLVAAAGNFQSALACPAIHNSVIATGFHQRDLQVVDGVRFVGSTEVMSLRQSFFADVTIDLIPGFAGTSFAGPLLAGFGALTDRPGEVRRGVAAHQATSFVRERQMTLCPPPMPLTKGQEPFASVSSLYAECDAFFDEAHIHGPGAGPCALCSLYYDEFWQMKGLLFFGAGDFAGALELLEHGARVAPRAAELLRNLAATLRALALNESRRELRADLLFRAAATWRRADHLSVKPSARADNANEALAEAVEEMRKLRN